MNPCKYLYYSSCRRSGSRGLKIVFMYADRHLSEIVLFNELPIHEDGGLSVVMIHHFFPSAPLMQSVYFLQALI